MSNQKFSEFSNDIPIQACKQHYSTIQIDWGKKKYHSFSKIKSYETKLRLNKNYVFGYKLSVIVFVVNILLLLYFNIPTHLLKFNK